MPIARKNAGQFAIALLSATALCAHAGPTSDESVLIAPKCLLNQATIPYKTISSSETLVLLRTAHNNIDKLIDAKNKNQTLCGGFMDVTTAWNTTGQAGLSVSDRAKDFLTTTFSSGKKKKITYNIKYQTEVNQLLTQLNPQDMWADLTVLSGFDDRHANSDNGVEAAAWIKTQVDTIAKNTGHTDVTTYYVPTSTRYKQPSLVMKIGNNDEAGVVIGAHMDTLISSWDKRPGADDDGSGSVTILEAARVLLTSGMHFKKPIYFIWYAAEEEGLVGSQQVVVQFKKKKIPVNAVIHFDMTGFAYQNEPTMWVMDDYTNKDLTTYITSLITTYVKKPVKHSRCGYACSDHASWSQAGYPATIPAEAAYEHTNPVLHSSQDTMDKLSLEHMTDYAKLSIAAAVELAEPVAK